MQHREVPKKKLHFQNQLEAPCSVIVWNKQFEAAAFWGFSKEKYHPTGTNRTTRTPHMLVSFKS